MDSMEYPAMGYFKPCTMSDYRLSTLKSMLRVAYRKSMSSSQANRHKNNMQYSCFSGNNTMNTSCYLQEVGVLLLDIKTYRKFFLLKHATFCDNGNM